MEILEKTPDLLPRLKSFTAFSDIDDSALNWLIEKSQYTRYPSDEYLFQPGDPIDHMQIILQGKFAIRVIRGGETRELNFYEAGYVTGVLPFSRMEKTGTYGVISEDCYILELHRSYFPEMVEVSYALVQNLVGLMSNRIREFSQLKYQTEKLMSLGKMSAGLAHELNNPASAMVRSAEALYNKIHMSPEKFKAVITMPITPEKTDQVNDILFKKIDQGRQQNRPLMEREDAFDELIDWLEDHGIEEDDMAETFVEFNLTPQELDHIYEIIDERSLSAILWWIESTLSLELLVQELRESADRIAKLVQSIKAYSYMDRGASMESIDLLTGLDSTLTLLKFKLKKKNIQVERDYQEDLPSIQAFPAELNQLWTNLIVNAIDAMEQNGRLEVKAFKDRDFVVVTITDNGVGIPEEHLSRIFEPFFTIKPMGEGTGIGLEISKRIVDRHKADIKVKSKPGATTFTIQFPGTL